MDVPGLFHPVTSLVISVTRQQKNDSKRPDEPQWFVGRSGGARCRLSDGYAVAMLMRFNAV
jgi:hypothetical protein